MYEYGELEQSIDSIEVKLNPWCLVVLFVIHVASF